jgi:hypothetical protein
MALISDTAGIVVGPVLDAFLRMQTVVARDGDLVGAQDAMLKAMTEINTTLRTDFQPRSNTATKRPQ